jgi:hypothetical protein
MIPASEISAYQATDSAALSLYLSALSDKELGILLKPYEPQSAQCARITPVVFASKWKSCF